MNQPGGSSPNVALLRQTMDAILANPEKHDQSMWATRTDCGTAYCFAGMVCHLNGLEPQWRGVDAEISGVLIDGEMISFTAEELLGIDHETAYDLFHANNTTADLKHYIDQIAEHGCIIEPIDHDNDVTA